MNIEQAEEMLLRGDRITLTAPVVPVVLCQQLTALHAQSAPMTVSDLKPAVLRVADGLSKQLGRELNDGEKQIANSLGALLTTMEGGKARSYVALLISEKLWFPDRKTAPGLEKRAVERQTKILAMAGAHLKEAQRRGVLEAEEARLRADRAAKTPEQRAAFVAETLAKFRQGMAVTT